MRHAELAAKVDEAISLVEAAQGADGYINTYYTVAEPGKRWTDFGHGHELYCAGHLFQAAVAHHRATGSDRLLNVATRCADYIDSLYGPGKQTATPGHPEIEMALAAGASPERISYGNTIKKERDIARAFALGIRLFAVDCKAEVEKIARAAAGSRVFCRILSDCVGAEWPLSRKFGCEPGMAVDVLEHALKVDFWDVEELADRILDVLTGPDLRHRLVEGGRGELEQMQWSTRGRHLRAIYEEVAP